VKDAELEQLRAELSSQMSRKRRQPGIAWMPPLLSDFTWERPVLAFDQSLSNCGWVALAIIGGRVVVYNKGTVRPVVAAKGFSRTWNKAYKLRQDLKVILSWYPGYEVVYENPAVHGHRLESSLLASQVLYDLTERKGHHIDAQHACKVLCGAPMRSEERKQAIKTAVARYIRDSETRHWNEHQRDAAALGLTHLYDLRQAA